MLPAVVVAEHAPNLPLALTRKLALYQIKSLFRLLFPPHAPGIVVVQHAPNLPLALTKKLALYQIKSHFTHFFAFSFPSSSLVCNTPHTQWPNHSPSQSQSTAQPDTDDLISATTNAEDRKAAAALSSFDARGDDDENDNGKAGAGKGVNDNIDQGTSIT